MRYRKRTETSKEIAHKEGISLPEEVTVAPPEFNNVDLEKDLLKDNQLYLERIEFGKKIARLLR